MKAVSEARTVTVRCSVYGGRDGKVAFLDVPEGVMPPPYIAHMVILGRPHDVVTEAVNCLLAEQEQDLDEQRHRRAAPQQALAEMLGVIQQDVSRWMNAKCAPRLTDDQWAKLVCLMLRREFADFVPWRTRSDD